MPTDHFRVYLSIKKEGDFYVAEGSLRVAPSHPWSLSDILTPALDSGKCQSRDSASALSYALTELAVQVNALQELPK